MKCKIIYLRKHLTKIKRKRNKILTKQNEVLISQNNVNTKYEKVINLFDKAMTNEINEKKNNNIKFKQRKENINNY